VIEIRRCSDPQELLEVAGEELAAREAEHNLIFGILGGIGRNRLTFGGEPYLGVALRERHVAAVAVCTPPYGPTLAETNDVQAVQALAGDLHSWRAALPGVHGGRDVSRAFAQRWEALAGVGARVVMAQRIYQTVEATRPAGVPGAARLYDPDDEELVLRWVEAFTAEAGDEAVPQLDAEAWLERKLDDPDAEIMLWQDGDRPVSIAVSGSATPTGLRVGPVYTPPEKRRRGYAEAVTAEVTARALATGRRFCFLFTDLGNPTSNAIYQRIGYRPVSDVDQWVFEER
jgi:uncharacterized protein